MSVIVTAAHAEGSVREAMAHHERYFPLSHRIALGIANPSRAADSLVEFLSVIRPDDTDEAWAIAQARRMLTNVGRWHAHGRIEVERAHEPLCDVAPPLRAMRVTRTPFADVQDAIALASTFKTLREALVGPLADLVAAEAGGRPAPSSAWLTVCRVIAETPRSRLLDPTLVHELGEGPSRVLARLVDEYHGVAA